MIRIEVPIASYKGFEVKEMIASYVEVNYETLTSIQAYHSIESYEDENLGEILKEYYRERHHKLKVNCIVGLEKSYLQDDDVWRLKITANDGDCLIYLVPTESEATNIFQKLDKSIFK